MSDTEPTKPKPFVPLSFWVCLLITPLISPLVAITAGPLVLLVPIAAIVVAVHFGFVFGRKVGATYWSRTGFGILFSACLTVLFFGLIFLGCSYRSW